ncbi:hypothetical protein PF327_10870 [Sulfurovum sp. XTW-4]|uniref:Uncharacterized protein n=1 Tax=Sulfurovum xiamenensis TaxID=3019066 RepID=A0ABT7QVA1_9BACT|nr:hypothetical protein [Sulfurovum xiamenensis]MDM5264697.1 hypothetical protein [Sulfurovum xiamenensis]
MTDRLGNLIKIGDTIKNKGGMKGIIKNICGVTRICVEDSQGRIIQTLKLNEVNLENFEKVS